MKPGTMTFYFATSDVAAAHKELEDKGVKVNEVKDGIGNRVISFSLLSAFELEEARVKRLADQRGPFWMLHQPLLDGSLGVLVNHMV